MKCSCRFSGRINEMEIGIFGVLGSSPKVGEELKLECDICKKTPPWIIIWI
jgi:hypothetical protein